MVVLVFFIVGIVVVCLRTHVVSVLDAAGVVAAVRSVVLVVTVVSIFSAAGVVAAI